MLQIKVSFLIVSWNVKGELSACIDSIYSSKSSFECEIIVVDNASSDDTVLHLKKNYPKVKVIENIVNAGFGRANNQAAKHANGEYLLILNPDTVILADAIDQLVGFLDRNQSVSMCAPCVLNKDSSVQGSIKGFPTLKGAFGKYTIFKFFGLFRTDVKNWRNYDFDYTKKRDVDQIMGAAMLIRRLVFEKHNGFDETFFMYYEEVDLCYRIKYSGGRISYYPKAEIMHWGGASSKQIFVKKELMMMQSLLLYLRKHNQSACIFILLPLFKFGVLSKKILELVYSLVVCVVFTLFFYSKSIDKWKRKFKNVYVFITKYGINFLCT